MPSIRRSAKAGTAEIIVEDLRLAREGGGLEQADPKSMLGTVAMLGIRDTDDLDTAVRAARAVIATHLRRTCESVIADPASDPCSRAAAHSLHALLLRPAGTDDKVATIRRAALTQYGCSLTLDGLRKREDALIERTAANAHADLLQRERDRGPQTVEEAVRHSGPLIETVHEELHESLPLVYQIAPSTDERRRRGFMWHSLLGVAVTLEHLRQVVELRARPGSHSPVDFLFADIAHHVMLVTLAEGNDKVTAHEVLTSIEKWEIGEFITAMHVHPNGKALLDRWGAWIQSCHPTCAYQRADVVRLCCGPHQLTTALQEFGVSYHELIDGTLEAFVREELGTWNVDAI